MNKSLITGLFLNDNDNNAISFNNSIELIFLVIFCIAFVTFSILNRVTLQRIGL